MIQKGIEMKNRKINQIIGRKEFEKMINQNDK